VARSTYRYSTRQIKKSGNGLWPRRAVSLLANRRGLTRLNAVIPHLMTSWRAMKSIERHLRHRLGLARYGGGAVPLKHASQQFLSYAKTAAQIDGVCDFSTLKHKLKHLAGMGLASKALSQLYKLSRRRGLERRRSDRRRLFRSNGRMIQPRDGSGRSIRSKEAEDSASEKVSELAAETKASVSWGELIQQGDDRHNALLKQYNNRVFLI
jgi:hypothetical protein